MIILPRTTPELCKKKKKNEKEETLPEAAMWKDSSVIILGISITHG